LTVHYVIRVVVPSEIWEGARLKDHCWWYCCLWVKSILRLGRVFVRRSVLFGLLTCSLLQGTWYLPVFRLRSYGRSPSRLSCWIALIGYSRSLTWKLDVIRYFWYHLCALLLKVRLEWTLVGIRRLRWAHLFEYLAKLNYFLFSLDLIKNLAQSWLGILL